MHARTSIFGWSFQTTILAGCCTFASVAVLAAPARAYGIPLTDPACEAGYAPVIACEEVTGTTADGHRLPCDAVAGNDGAARQTLLGDVGGLRPGLAASGITADLDLTQVYQGVATGGEEQNGAYGGHSDLLLNFDFSKMGGPKGLFLKVRGEGNFGEAITESSGVLLPPGIQTELPVADERNYAVTNFLVTQALSEQSVGAVVAGVSSVVNEELVAGG